MEGARLVGFHVTSQVPSGFVALRSGIAMSEANSLRITLTGPGGHGAMPSATGDVIRATAELVSRLGEVARGLRYEETDCVCSAGTVHAGTAVNVVPTSARVTGTLRTFTEAQHEEALVRLQDLCDGIGDDQGVHVRARAARAHPGRGQRRRCHCCRRGGGQRRARPRQRLPHATGGAERRRQRIPAPPARLLLLRRRRCGRRFERDAPQPDLPRRGRVPAGRGQCPACAAPSALAAP